MIANISAADSGDSELIVAHLNEKCHLVTVDYMVYECTLSLRKEHFYSLTISCQSDSDAHIHGFGNAIATWMTLANKTIVVHGKRIDLTNFSERPRRVTDDSLELSILLEMINIAKATDRENSVSDAMSEAANP